MNKKEIEILSKLMNSEIDSMEGFSKLIPDIEGILKNNEQHISSEKELMYLLYREVAKHIGRDELSTIKMNKYLACGIIKESISSKEPLLQQQEILGIIQSMDSIEMIDELLNDDTLELTSELRNNILLQREKLLTHIIYDGNGNEIGTIMFSNDEIKAIKAYVGEDVGYSFYPDNDCTYMILNAFLKAGNTLGETSAGWQHKKSILAILENPEEFMDFALNLSDALHKYGKTIKEPISISRSEPNAKYILETKKTMSFFSATQGIEELDRFKRDSKDSITSYVKYGVDAIDIGDTLKGDYSKPEEREVLISPFIPFSYKTLSEKEYKAEDQVCTYKRMVGTYELEFQSGTISKKLSEEEKREYQESMQIFLDSNLRKQCVEIWKDYLYTDKEPYFKWREAFSKVFSYKQRERALTIDKEIESGIEYSENRNTAKNDRVFQEREIGKTTISTRTEEKDKANSRLQKDQEELMQVQENQEQLE